MWDVGSLLAGAAAGAGAALAGCWYWATSAYVRGTAEGAVERARLEERLGQQTSQLEEMESMLIQRFEGMSSAALRKNNESFIHLAKATLDKYQQGARDDLAARQQSIEQLTRPIRERLDMFDTKLDDLEKSRVGAYRAIDQQMKSLLETHLPQLHAETANLVKALRQPTTRGRWGEVQLRRVVELAGMLEHCDFIEQETAHTEAGRLRPDM
ncbi:MAG: DNA recombination protein RmuC, partial [Planctomycetales bacterium]|nr:DNA recombination protein RmuC [Planctomycetales bacterium]